MQFLVVDIQMTSTLIQTATLTIAIMLVRTTTITPVMQTSIEVMVVGQLGAGPSKRPGRKMLGPMGFSGVTGPCNYYKLCKSLLVCMMHLNTPLSCPTSNTPAQGQ